METMVLSGINLFEGGTLSIYLDCLDYLLEKKLYQRFHIIAFVHKKSLFQKYESYVELIELPKSRKNYIFRIYYEYIYFYFFSLSRDITYWISLHDMTPNVRTKKLYTYCHNPAPFMENPKSVKKYSKNIYNMARYYKYIYKINIKKNNAVIVQQEWLRDRFCKMFGIENVIVATPNIVKNNVGKDVPIRQTEGSSFIYASYPRAFKNFEVICEAAKILENAGEKFEVLLTIEGNENSYSRELYKRYHDIESVKWIGIKTREQIFDLYEQIDCMIFPSKLETWGLPISEYKNTGKTLMVADLAYAHETVGKYEKACFFDADNPQQLAKLMGDFIKNRLVYSETKEVVFKKPYAKNWNELFELILE